MLDGVLELDVGGEHFRLEAGDCLVTRFGVPTAFRNPSARSAVRYAVIVSHGGTRP